MKRTNFSTPKNYLDFLNNYQRLLEQNRVKYSDMIIRYQNGLSKLIDAASQVTILQQELEIKQVEVNQEKELVESLIEDIKQKTEIASKHQF